MSKRKHNIAYIKPDEPKFLRELKIQAGYKEGPTVDTKREIEPEIEDEDSRDDTKDDEQPVVVVLKEGDLTAEQADEIQKKKQEEEANAKADLSIPPVFNKNIRAKMKTDHPERKKMKKSEQKQGPLSFGDEEEEE